MTQKSPNSCENKNKKMMNIRFHSKERLSFKRIIVKERTFEAPIEMLLVTARGEV